MARKAAPKKRDGTHIRKGVKGTSSTGKVKNVNADQTNWRRKVQQSRLKFDDDTKRVFLEELAASGLKGRAAKKAGISMQTVGVHRENDPDFEEAFIAAEATYRDSLAEEVTRRGRDGWLEPVFGKDGRHFDNLCDDQGVPIMRHKETGELVYAHQYALLDPGERKKVLEPVLVPATIRKFSDRMLELDLKRVDPTYRDKSSVDVNATGGGVLVAPAGVSPEDWIKREEEKNGGRVDPRLRAKQAEAEEQS